MNITNLKTNLVIANPNDKDNFNRYLLEIGKLSPLTREEEVEAFKRIEAGDNKAIELICKHNLLFVVSVAKRYGVVLRNTSITLEDLISEGNIGLCLAISKFNYKIGNKFISFAVWSIKQQILACIQKNIKSIRIPSNIASVRNKMMKKEGTLEQILSRKPTTLELFEAMLDDGDLSEKDRVGTLEEILKITDFEKSLNTLAFEDGESELQEMLKCEDAQPDTALEQDERKRLTLELIKDLPSQVKEYVYDYFGLEERNPLELKEIAEKYNVSVGKVKHEIKKHLRHIKVNNYTSLKFFFPTFTPVFNGKYKDMSLDDIIYLS